MARGVLIAWVVLAGSFSVSAHASHAAPEEASVEAATVAPAPAAPARYAVSRDASGTQARLPAAPVASAHGSVLTEPTGSVGALWDRRAAQRRAIPRRAPPRLSDDGFH